MNDVLEAESHFDEFVGAWRAQFPALALAEIFAAAEEAPSLLARAILAMEFCDAIWRVSDQNVGAVKLRWWAEELQRTVVVKGIHPLSLHLRIRTDSNPLLAFFEELEVASYADTETRFAAYQKIADGLVSAFSVPSNNQALSDAASQTLWLALIVSRHVAAVSNGAALAVAALPLDLRARFEIAATAIDSDLARRCAIAYARILVVTLLQNLKSLPKGAWERQRGASVLTHLIVRDLLHIDKPNSTWTRWKDAIAAWRSARSVGMK